MVPYIAQRNISDCGAAALAMVMAYYGKRTDYSEIIRACRCEAGGTSLLNIQSAARTYGMDVRCFFCRAEDLNETQFPLILHWKRIHFVVLLHLNEKYAVVIDPRCGKQRISRAEFLEGFSGSCLQAKPGAGFQKEKNKHSLWIILRGFFAPVRRQMFLLLSAGIAAEGFYLARVLMNQTFIDRIMYNEPEKSVHFLIIFLIITITGIILKACCGMTSLVTERKATEIATESLFCEIFKLPVDYISRHGAGDLSDRLQEPERLIKGANGLLLSLILRLLTVGFSFAVMAYCSLWLAVGMAALFAFGFWLTKRQTGRMNATFTEHAKQTADLREKTVSELRICRQAKACGLEQELIQIHASAVDLRVKADRDCLRIEHQYELSVGLFSKLVSAIVLVAGVVLLMDGQMTCGFFFVIQGMVNELILPLQSLFTEQKNHIRRNISADRYHEIILQEKRPKQKQCQMKQVNITDLTFSYSENQRKILSGINFSFCKGEIIGLTGPCGSGKSTLAGILAGWYLPESGSITIVDYEEKAIPGAANLGSVIYLEGTGTVFTGLSGGQVQMLELNNALNQRPELLILDEATDALDAGTEQEVFQKLRRNGCAVLVITQKQSTLKYCDRIYYLMPDGKLKPFEVLHD